MLVYRTETSFKDPTGMNYVLADVLYETPDEDKLGEIICLVPRHWNGKKWAESPHKQAIVDLLYFLDFEKGQLDKSKDRVE
jgi:hypothetical protein